MKIFTALWQIMLLHNKLIRLLTSYFKKIALLNTVTFMLIGLHITPLLGMEESSPALSVKEYRNIRTETKKQVLAWLEKDGVRFISRIFKQKPKNPADNYHAPSFNMLWHDVSLTQDPLTNQICTQAQRDQQDKQAMLNSCTYKLVILTRTFETSDIEKRPMGTLHLYSDNGLSGYIDTYPNHRQLRTPQELTDNVIALIKAHAASHITSPLGTVYLGESFVGDSEGCVTFAGRRIKFAYADQTEHGPIPTEPYYFDLGGVISITLKLLGVQHRLIIDYGSFGTLETDGAYASDPKDNRLIFLLPKIAPKNI